jgi:SAM-dependent methyltransferase
MDWTEWHAGYDDPGSKLARRLEIVQSKVRDVLDHAAAGPVTVLSMCAGQGRDLLGVLDGHPRRADVRARLVELDPRNVAFARSTAPNGVEVIEGDAGLIDHYLPLTPADLVLACGVFGNVTDADIQRTVEACSALCREGGTVIWTRHRGDPDRFESACGWFEDHGFEQLFATPPEMGFGVGAHRLTRPPAPIAAGERMFTFVGSDVLRARLDP